METSKENLWMMLGLKGSKSHPNLLASYIDLDKPNSFFRLL